jgi:hypothetical protein
MLAPDVIRGGRRFSAENAIEQTNLERIPVQLNRKALWRMSRRRPAASPPRNQIGLYSN